MAQSSRFWESTSYTDENFAEVMNRFLSNGVIFGAANGLAVTDGSGMTALVDTGEGMVNGTWFKNDSSATLNVTAAHATLNRIDRVVLRRTASTNTLVLAMLDGTAGASPSAPGLTQTTAVYEISLAQISVAAAITEITAAMVTNERTWAMVQSSGIDIPLTNASGGAVALGDVVILDSTAQSFNTTSSANNQQVIGAVRDLTVANGSVGWIRIYGVAYVNVTALTSVTNFLYTSTTVKKAAPSASVASGMLGRALTATTGAGTCLALIHLDVA